MKRYLFLLLILFPFLSLGGAASLAGGQEDITDRAAKSIKAKDYSAAIAFCLDGLKRNHLDYELNFLLSRAYAYSGRWDEALSILNELALAHPENADVLLFQARVEAWEKKYSRAEKGYNEVLRLNPSNIEAMIGLAELASWQGDFPKALSIYGQVREQDPANADIHFRIGRIYLWEGNFAQAEGNFKEAFRLDPKNEEYRRALQKAKPRLVEKFELRYEHQTDSFSDERTSYLDQNLALQMSIFKSMGPLVLKLNHTNRSSQNDYRYGLEFYPRLWKRAYGYLDLSYSPKALYYPETSYLLEVYQGVFSAAEISIGFRRMNFVSEPVSQYLGSLGYYFGNYYAYWRWYYSQEDTGDRFSWVVNLRRYFSEKSYIFVGYGRGTRPFDIVALEDIRADQTWVFLAGFDWYFLKKIKLQAYYSIGNEGDLRRQTLFISTGYCW
jgi:YaiO family outer membrane protein